MSGFYTKLTQTCPIHRFAFSGTFCYKRQYYNLRGEVFLITMYV